MKKPLLFAATPKFSDNNPSKMSQRIRICLVATPAVLVATYMGLFQLGLIDHIWDPFFGNQSELVLKSEVSHILSKWLRIPDAILGAIAYLGDIIFALAGTTRRWRDHPWLVLLFGLDVIPLGLVSVILVILQGTVVGSWCFLCLVTASISLVLIFLAYGEVLSSMIFLMGVWKKSKSKRLLWNTFWGKSSEVAYEVGKKLEG